MKKPLVLFLMVITCFCLQAQMTLRITDPPEHYNPILDTIYVAGTFNNWNPGDPASICSDNGNGQLEVAIPGSQGTVVEYKFTRGDWGRVETRSDDSFLPNRSVTFTNGAIVDHQIARWADFPGVHTATGSVYVLDANFFIPQFNDKRRIWIYLPPDYTTSSKNYPVLYMLDGQNLFDRATTAFGTEWSVDEAVDGLHALGKHTAIIVGIDNGGQQRIDEYTPWTHPQYGGGMGEKTVDFIVNDLKPFIDNQFRTFPGRESTGIAGSSLGGLMAMYAVFERQDVFSRAGVFSPSFWYSDSSYTHVVSQGITHPIRIYMLAGDQEGGNMVQNMYRMRDSLVSLGGNISPQLLVTNHVDGQHSEWYWAREFPTVFEWLFDSTALTIEELHRDNWYCDMQDSTTLLVTGPQQKETILQLFDTQGNIVRTQIVKNEDRVNLGQLTRGIYIARLGGTEAHTVPQKIFINY